MVNNRAGNTEFVDAKLVPGTLEVGFGYYAALTSPLAKAVYMMFLIRRHIRLTTATVARPGS